MIFWQKLKVLNETSTINDGINSLRLKREMQSSKFNETYKNIFECIFDFFLKKFISNTKK